MFASLLSFSRSMQCFVMIPVDEIGSWNSPLEHGEYSFSKIWVGICCNCNFVRCLMLCRSCLEHCGSPACPEWVRDIVPSRPSQWAIEQTVRAKKLQPSSLSEFGDSLRPTVSFDATWFVVAAAAVVCVPFDSIQSKRLYHKNSFVKKFAAISTLNWAREICQHECASEKVQFRPEVTSPGLHGSSSNLERAVASS